LILAQQQLTFEPLNLGFRLALFTLFGGGQRLRQRV